MMYFESYIQTFKRGIDLAVFEISGEEVSGNNFIESLRYKIKEVSLKKGTLFFLGNGASASFSSHMALDFLKNAKVKTRTIPDVTHLSAYSNDFCYEDSFLRFLEDESSCSADLVITISSSGNSPNVLKAIDYCKKNGILTLGLSGLKSDNSSKKLSDYSVYCPMKTYGMVECMHQLFLHLILDFYMEVMEWQRDDSQNMNSNNFKL